MSERTASKCGCKCPSRNILQSGYRVRLRLWIGTKERDHNLLPQGSKRLLSHGREASLPKDRSHPDLASPIPTSGCSTQDGSHPCHSTTSSPPNQPDLHHTCFEACSSTTWRVRQIQTVSRRNTQRAASTLVSQVRRCKQDMNAAILPTG